MEGNLHRLEYFNIMNIIISSSFYILCTANCLDSIHHEIYMYVPTAVGVHNLCTLLFLNTGSQVIYAAKKIKRFCRFG